jgi:hypothetical protein
VSTPKRLVNLRHERWLYIAPVDAVERFLSGRLS